MNPATTPTPRTDAIQRITDYLLSGGLFNPELAIHDRVRDLLMDCRTELTELHNEVARLRDALREHKENQNTFAMALLEEPEREVARLRELLNAKTEYITFLEKESEKTAVFLHTHHWRYPEEDFKRGEALRQGIKDAQAALAPAPEEPVIQKRQLTKPPTTSMGENNTQKHINTLMDALENLRRDTDKHYTGYRDPDHVIRDSEARHIAISKLSDAILWLYRDLVSELTHR